MPYRVVLKDERPTLNDYFFFFSAVLILGTDIELSSVRSSAEGGEKCNSGMMEYWVS
jgi:hypothetical protein